MARIVVIDTEGDIEHVLDRLFPNGHQVVVAFDGAALGSTPPQPEQAAAVAKAFDVPVEMLGSQPAAKTKRRPTRTTSPEAVALMEAVAEAYNGALAKGTATGAAVEAVDGIRNGSMASYYVGQARKAGLITVPAKRSGGVRRPTVAAVPDLEPDPEPDDAEDELEEAPPPKPVFADPAPFIKRGPVDVDAARARASEVI